MAEGIELREERCNRLVRHCPDYDMANILEKVALKKILVGKTRENYELWEGRKARFWRAAALQARSGRTFFPIIPNNESSIEKHVISAALAKLSV